MRPSVIGIVSDGPINDSFVCDAESSGPSSVWRHGSDSGTTLSSAYVVSHTRPCTRRTMSMSVRTSRS